MSTTTSAMKTVTQAEEEFLMKISKKATTTTGVKKTTKGKTVKKVISDENLELKIDDLQQKQQQQQHIENNNNIEELNKNMQQQEPEQQAENTVINKKKKIKKTKKSDINNDSVSVKTSFSKFDTLEKRNASKDPEDNKKLCRLCTKPVYKMEEIKAVKSVFHKNCFRCHDCNKLLNIDNYQSNESIIYCTLHFKLLLGPRAVDNNDDNNNNNETNNNRDSIKNTQIPELIIRENQPVELPPEVVRASLKSDLGLADLQQINLRSRFEIFENPKGDKNKKDHDNERKATAEEQNIERKKNSIRMKLAKFQKLISMETNDQNDDEREIVSNDDEDDNVDDDHDDLSEIPTRERPIGIGQVMQDIREKFEKGPLLAKQDRREECKQEIQNIRSRLFTGKQARIKEMYQQAVAEAEQGITSAGKLENIERSSDARDLKERFENGAFFRENSYTSENTNNDVEIFNSGISKQSRSLFMELDATVLAEKQQKHQQTSSSSSNHSIQNEQKKKLSITTENNNNNSMEIIKSDEKLEDIKIETSDVSNKFKFFETYRPNVHQKREFRMTPPREGVVKMPTNENNNNNHLNNNDNDDDNDVDELKEKQLLEKSHTTSKMLHKFREIEENSRKNHNYNMGPKPLKSFTPPPDDGRRIYAAESDDEGSYSSQYDDDDDDEESSENDMLKIPEKSILNDDALNEAKAAARAQSLRAKFEKWEAKDMLQSKVNEQVDIYSKEVSDESNIESTKSIRERFERMQNDEERLRSPAARPRHQVNRFI